jgi:uncharacterized protein (TIGR03435 family)
LAVVKSNEHVRNLRAQEGWDMQRFDDVCGSRGKKLFTGAVVHAAAALIVFGFASTVPGKAQAQSTPADARVFEYEVASIKPSKPYGGGGNFTMGLRYTPDGFVAENFSLTLLIQTAYGVGRDRITGLPDWVNSERYDIDAKMDGAAAEELKKLNPDQLKTVRQQMLQALLADRFKLSMHRETKDLAIYTLVIVKNGPKFHESKPDDTSTSGSNAPSGPSAPNGPTFTAGPGGKSVNLAGGGSTSFSSGGARTISGKGVPIANLIGSLATVAGRPVFDGTGLTGKYDYSLQWTQEASQQQGALKGVPGDPPSLDAPDSSGTSLFTAIQEQLGLKLESGKGPVEIIAIDHIEKPSGN